MHNLGNGSRRHRLHLEHLEARCLLAAQPLITEFMASNATTLLDGNGDSSDWVEIYNPTAAIIELDGWHLTDNASNPTKWTFPAASLSPGGYLVVFASNKPSPDYVDPLGYLHTTYALSAGGEYLGLVSPNGTVVSEFAPKYPSQSTDVSYGFDEAGRGAYFTRPTPGAANDFASALTRGVVISEIMYHPASELPADEFVELYNADSAPIDLRGWTLSGGVEFTFPPRTLGAGERLAVAADLAAFAAKYPDVTKVVGGWQGKLSNRGERLTLLDAAGREADSVSHFDEGDWATREEGPLDFGHRGWVWSDAHDGGGSSLELVSASLSNAYGANWAASLVAGGTPGAVNSAQDADGDAAPLVLDVAHAPSIPRSSEPVVITARLLDEQSTGLSATLWHRIDGAAAFATMTMVDDGSGADAVAGDQLFTASLAPLPDGTVVEFYVESFDAAGNQRTYPSPTLPSGVQQTNLLYQVDDSFDAAMLPGLGDPPEYRLIMTEAERAELEEIGSSQASRFSHARMNGTLISATSGGVEVRYQIGIRNRGQGSSIRKPNSYHVDIPRDRPWQGLEAFNLNTQYTHLQLAGLQLFQAAGAVAEDSQTVKVRVNGVDLSIAGSPSYGVYVQMEAADNVFAANHFPEDDGGNLYKAVRDSQSRARADFRDLGDDPAAYAPYYEKQTNASEADYSDLLELVQVLNYEPDATYYDRLQQIVDVDQWLSYFATIAILSSEETSLGNGTGDDYLMYRGERDPRFVLIPHDLDTIFGQGDTPSSPESGIYRATNIPTMARFLYHPQILPQYHAKLRDLLLGTFSKERLDPLLDELLSGFAPAAQIASMKSFMDARRTFILNLVDTPLTVRSPLPTVSGFPRYADDNVALSGKASLAGTQSVTAGGLLADYDPLSGSWTLGFSSGGVVGLVRSGDVWHYLDAGDIPSTAPGADWRIDDPGWTKSGPSQLGYGDTQRTTVQYVDANPSQSGTQKNITTYFRTTFHVDDAASFTQLDLRLLRDDGAVVYLNGVEAVRSNMPLGVEITPTTLAAGTVDGSREETFFDYALNPALLRDGENVIAVEVHQINQTSSDIGFDLELFGTLGIPGSIGGVPLTPGINRVEVRAHAELGGAGGILDSTYIDVWYDAAGGATVGGDIVADTVWAAAQGPYVATSDVVVRGDATLTIEPGTTVFFNGGAGLTVRDGGRLVAEGTPDARIYFAQNPSAGAASWDGVAFLDTAADNRLTYIDMHAGDASGQALLVDTATLLVDHASWSGVNAQILDLIHPKLTVRNSVLPGISGDETVHLLGLDQGEEFIFENNVVGFNASGNDVMDFGHDTLTPPTIVIRGNHFLGSYDDGIDTDGFPVLIEYNTFENFHLNTSRTTTSNAVSTGRMSVAGQTISSQLTLRHNTFINNDHHLLLKDFSFATLENNTFVGANIAAIQLAEVGGTSVIGPGRGAAIDGNIFWDNAALFANQAPTTELTLDRSIIPPEFVALGAGNSSADPLLVDPPNGDFSVARYSPALGAGPGGSDIGAWQTPRYAPATAANLAITELHYHPLPGDKPSGEIGGDADYFEFVELQNIGDEPIDLTDVAFDDGIQFAFPWLAALQPGEVVVLAKNLDLFQSRYGRQRSVFGEYGGQLANSGERIRLRDAQGAVIREIAYEDEGPWPTAADGAGPSLELVDPQADASDAANWLPSASDGGSPGVVAPPAPSADFNDDGFVDGSDLLRWQRGFGLTLHDAQAETGDADRDGDVDATDLLVWEQQFGTESLAAAGLAPAARADEGASATAAVAPASFMLIGEALPPLNVPGDRPTTRPRPAVRGSWSATASEPARYAPPTTSAAPHAVPASSTGEPLASSVPPATAAEPEPIENKTPEEA